MKNAKLTNKPLRELAFATGVPVTLLLTWKNRFKDIGHVRKRAMHIAEMAKQNNLPVSQVAYQNEVVDLFSEVGNTANTLTGILEAIQKHMPCQQAQYALQDAAAIALHCQDFIMKGPKPPDLEVPLTASGDTEETQVELPLAEEAFEAFTDSLQETQDGAGPG